MDLRFKLTDTAPTVVNINQPTTDAKIDLTGATSAASSTLTIAGTPLYLLKTISGVDYYVTSSTQPAASATNIYVVDSGRLVDVTNKCKLS